MNNSNRWIVCYIETIDAKYTPALMRWKKKLHICQQLPKNFPQTWILTIEMDNANFYMH